MKHFLNILFFIVPVFVFSQLQEDFSDGDFTNNPVWSGISEDFTVNSAKQLQTNAGVASTSYLSTPHLLSDLHEKEWKFYAKMAFAGSANNYARIYLTADNSDLTAVSNGYYIQLGEPLSTDAVRLFKVENNTTTQICASADGTIAASANIGVRILRSREGEWKLYVDFNGGTNYVLQSIGTDTSQLTGTHFGILGIYTTGNIKKIFLDDIYVGDEIIDLTPPSLLNAMVISATEVQLAFSENIEQASIETLSNYSINPSNTLISAIRDPLSHHLVQLNFANPFNNGTTYYVTIENVTDLFSNTTQIIANFTYLIAETAIAGDVVINEFMADPTPVIGLPEVEFVELYNRSNKYFNLTGWKLGDNATFGTINNAWLAPGEYKLLCASASLAVYPTAIRVTSMPLLNNDADDIILKDNNGTLIDKISYTDNWYRDPVKKQGGYTLELINPNSICSDHNNWIASTHELGGTPGLQNAVYDITSDQTPPAIKQVLALAPNILTLQFNEGLDSLSILNALYTFSPHLHISNIVLTEKYPSTVMYEFQDDLIYSQIYQFTIQNLSDCSGNSENLQGHFVLPDLVMPGDLVINEILFNPVTGGSDYVELKNISQKSIDLFELYITNAKTGASNVKQIMGHFILKPNEIAVLTADSLSQLQTYPATVPGRFIQMAIPAYNNDSSTVKILREELVIDKVSYTDKWQFRLLDNLKGKALERIDPKGNSNDSKNWHTAAESIGFGTPGRENSQYAPASESGDFHLTSETFSPDNDGFEDFLQINYRMLEPGMVANVTIYDDRGRMIKKVTHNELLGTEGSIIWDGLTTENQKASIGTYVVLFEAFKAEGGSKFAKRKAFILAGKL